MSLAGSAGRICSRAEKSFFSLIKASCASRASRTSDRGDAIRRDDETVGGLGDRNAAERHAAIRRRATRHSILSPIVPGVLLEAIGRIYPCGVVVVHFLLGVENQRTHNDPSIHTAAAEEREEDEKNDDCVRDNNTR